MGDDIVIRVERLGKKYLIGHRADRERYVALRDVVAHGVLRVWRKATDLSRGRPFVDGNTVEEFWALKDVSFAVKRGEVIGIIGRNGAGKSTLLKILSRITGPSEGRVTIHGRVASLLEVGTGFHPELTGRENIYLNGALLGMSRSEIRRKFDEIVGFSEIEKFLDTPVKRYSSGMYLRLAFAVAAHLEPEILIVDEVLAVGDSEFQKKCIGKISSVAGAGRTVLLVSHNLHSISSLCSRGLVLASGQLLLDSTIDQAISAYTTNAAHKTSSTANNVLYVNTKFDRTSDFVTRVEMFGNDLMPKRAVVSSEAIIFRIWIRCREALPHGSVILSVRTPFGGTLAKFETDPRRLQPMNRIGDHFVDCRIHSFPLMPGQYLISVGLAHYGIGLIDWIPDAATIDVYDVDGEPTMSGYPEGPLIIQHQWDMSSLPVSNESLESRPSPRSLVT
ncbi:MAG TPA: ABC transporter ATP-binding protein [Stellaceae bacterium]|nr:ABC transporter ATP-binding protein [Stellaceae bacterium]